MLDICIYEINTNWIKKVLQNEKKKNSKQKSVSINLWKLQSDKKLNATHLHLWNRYKLNSKTIAKKKKKILKNSNVK